ncbi:MAG: hypothetical protein IKV32_04280 [Muribaculaceae bacterium]|nr:hypothetical protein [Muribaculaceae bacterium]
MKKFLLLGAAVLGLSSMASAQDLDANVTRPTVNDGHTYEADAETGITCKSKWVIDRIHDVDKFLNLPFVKEAGTKARSAVVDTENSKIYIGYSKPVVVDSVSNDYAHLVVFDLESGAYEGEIALTCDGVPVSGLLCANQVGIDDAGNLWFAGMYSDVSVKPAQIYVVTDIATGACKNVGQWALPAEESGAGGRCDYWDVVGDITGETSNAVCMAAVGATTSGEKCCLYRWELAQGETEWVANEDDFAGYVSYYDGLDTYPADQATWGSSSATVRIVAEEGHVGSMFYVDGFTTCPSLYLSSLSLAESFASAPDLAPAVGCNGVNEFVLGEVPFIVYAEAQYNVSPGCRINVCQLGEGMTFEGMRKYWSLPEAGLGEVSDGGTRIHNIDVTVVDDENGKQGAYIFSYKNFNGLALYCVAEDGFNDKFEEGVGVEGIEVEEVEGEAVYYNLQGVKVANPENGLFIKKAGNNASKVLVK